MTLSNASLVVLEAHKQIAYLTAQLNYHRALLKRYHETYGGEVHTKVMEPIKDDVIFRLKHNEYNAEICLIDETALNVKPSFKSMMAQAKKLIE